MKEEDKILEDQAWSRMAEILDQQMPQQEKRRSTFFWWIGMSALFLVSAFAYVYLDFSDNSMVGSEVQDKQLFADNGSMNNEDISNGKIGSRESKLENDSYENASINIASLSPDGAVEETDDVVRVAVDAIDEQSNFERSPNNNNNNNEKYSDMVESPASIQINDEKSLSISAEIDIVLSVGDQVQNKAKRSEVDNVLHSSDFMTAKAEVSIDSGDQFNVESVQISKGVSIIDRLPMATLDLRYESKKYHLAQDRFMNVAEVSGAFLFGGYGSFQYWNEYFMGYDFGLTASYRRSKYGLSLNVGFERIHNRKETVLADAVVGVLVTDDNGSFEINNGAILNNSRNAGFQLQDIILSRSSLMMELKASYRFTSKFSFSSGFGYKRLQSVSTRPINGIEQDIQQDFNPDGLVVLDGDQVLNSTLVNRNRFYVPFEVNYVLFDNVDIGLGTQYFINKSFDLFDEKNKSIYSRISIKF